MKKTIPYASIDASDRLRPIDPDYAAFIAASVEEKGVQTPIVVAPRGDTFKLAEGGHRHAAFGLLGLTELEVGKHVVIEEMDEAQRKLREIDENLVRRELNPLDRALFLAKRQEIYEEINKVAGHGGSRKAEKFAEEGKSQTLRLGFAPRFSQDVADKVGLSERAVQLALHIAKSLDPVAVKKLRGTKIEGNQQALLSLCDLPADKQIAAARVIAEGEAKTVSEARIAIGVDKAPSTDPQPRILATLLDAWSKASRTTKANFLAEIGAEFVKSDAKGVAKPKKGA